MPRAPKRSFSALPAGAGGSSTNAATMERNRRRRKLSPLSAEYERARANRGNRVSSKLRKVKKAEEYMTADDAGRAHIEQEIRDAEEEVYQADKAKIDEQYAALQSGKGAVAIAAGRGALAVAVGSAVAIAVGAKASAVAGEEDSDVGEKPRASRVLKGVPSNKVSKEGGRVWKGKGKGKGKGPTATQAEDDMRADRQLREEILARNRGFMELLQRVAGGDDGDVLEDEDYEEGDIEEDGDTEDEDVEDTEGDQESDGAQDVD